MSNFKRWNLLLRMLSSVITGIVLLLAMCFQVLADEIDWRSLPKELRALALRQLLEQGDYRSFLNAYETSREMHVVIDSDPVLRGTLQGFQDEGLKALIERLPRDDNIQPIVYKIVEISDQASAVPGIRSQITTNLGYLLFNMLKKMLDSYIATGYGSSLVLSQMVYNIGMYIPEEYLPMFDKFLYYAANNVPVNPGKSRVALYAGILNGLDGLAINRNIPTSLVLDRVNHYIGVLPRIGVSLTEATGMMGITIEAVIKDTLRKLAGRPDMDDKTIQYFVEHENQAAWQEDPILKQALEDFRANPASHKGL